MFIAFQDLVNPVGTPVNVKDTKTSNVYKVGAMNNQHGGLWGT